MNDCDKLGRDEERSEKCINLYCGDMEKEESVF